MVSVQTMLETIFIIKGPSTFLHYIHSIFFKQISLFTPLAFKMTFNPCGYIVMSHTGTRMYILTAMTMEPIQNMIFSSKKKKLNKIKK